jgi:hypothetical protein
MQIAQIAHSSVADRQLIAPLQEAIPPKLYGGTERVIHWLTEELVARGMTLLCSLVETHPIQRNWKLRGRERCALTVRCATRMRCDAGVRAAAGR